MKGGTTMALFGAETIVLNEEDSIEFVNELVRPDSGYIARRNAIFDAMDSRMSFSECDDGFVVDIPDFDLSSVMANDVHEVSVSFDIKADELYEALMSLANDYSMFCNQIESREVYSTVNTWNKHGKTTKNKLPVFSRVCENEVEFNGRVSLDVAA